MEWFMVWTCLPFNVKRGVARVRTSFVSHATSSPMEILPNIWWRGVGLAVYWQTVTNRWYKRNKPTFDTHTILTSYVAIARSLDIVQL